LSAKIKPYKKIYARHLLRRTQTLKIY
jgi:hypothetical protein